MRFRFGRSNGHRLRNRNRQHRTLSREFAIGLYFVAKINLGPVEGWDALTALFSNSSLRALWQRLVVLRLGHDLLSDLGRLFSVTGLQLAIGDDDRHRIFYDGVFSESHIEVFAMSFEFSRRRGLVSQAFDVVTVNGSCIERTIRVRPTRRGGGNLWRVPLTVAADPPTWTTPLVTHCQPHLHRDSEARKPRPIVEIQF